jgi:NAD(P)-dependent dehydrogenase (short-subunit alcohol dehydrogenase family)
LAGTPVFGDSTARWTTVGPGTLNVVIIASEWGVIGWPEATAYSASTAGLIALMKTLGAKLATRCRA